MEKEGKANIKFIVLVLLFSLLLAFLVFAVSKPVFVDDVIRSPENITIDTSTDRNINFTFNVTWDSAGDDVGNCSLWTNFNDEGWENIIEFNGSAQGVYNESSNISVNRTSWVNYTFRHDLGSFNWSIACRNGTEGAALNWTFNANRTLAIDTAAPIIYESPTFFSGYNTSNATPSLTFNISDVNGTGVNLTTNGNNATLNITLYNQGDTTALATFNLSNSSFSCTNTGDSVTLTPCTINLNLITTFSFTNGTKNITIGVTDRAGWTNNLSWTFVVDQIPPVLRSINITNTNTLSTAGVTSVLNNTDSGYSIRQGSSIFLTTNFTDNLTQPMNISFQFWNVSKNSGAGGWTTINTTKFIPAGPGGATQAYWGNISFTIPEGRNVFEGRNVTFRIQWNDTLANSNTTSATLAGIPLIVQVNDTYAPTIIINATDNGVAMINGSNITNTRPLISWAVDENNKLTSINVSVDGVSNKFDDGDGVDGCGKSAWYDTTIGAKNVELFRNGSFQISEIGDCTALGNGTHFINVTAKDIWNNSRTSGWTFNIQSGSIPGLAFVNLTHDSTITWSKNNVNKSNITSVVGLGIGGASNGGLAGGNIQSLIYTSSCDSVPVTFANNSVIYPFNRSSACRTESENRTVKITVTDSAGNSNSTVLGFTVDNVAPIITVHDPTPGFSTTGKIEVNVSAYDGESQIEWIRYYLDGNSVSFNHTQNGSAITPSFGQNTSTIRGGEINKTINFTAGTHRLKISVNDTLGNVRNSSEITFTYNGPLNFLTVNQSLTAYAPSNYTNISIYNSSGGLISDSSTPRSVDETYQLFLALNKSTESSPINVTINFNGSAANWDALNFSIEFNESSLASWEGIQNNFTAKIVDLITFNGSFDDFLTDSNSYYGFIDFDINVTNITGGGAQPLGSVYELWYFEDESTWTSKVNITECAVNKAITHSTSSGNNFPCWNNTLNKTVRVYVPHFSAIALVNNSRPPTVTRNTPGTLQEIGGFIPNITVSFDTVSCQYILNGTDSSASSNISSRVTAGLVNSVNYCTWDEIYFKNGIYNITYNATDSNGNVNLTNGTTFTMLDGTASNSGTSIDESSIETTTATVLISGVNESVNATVWYGTTVSALTYSKIQTAFSASPSVSLTGLSASTMYHYNVTLRDYNGNPVRNGTFNFTTGAAATTTSDDSSSSSGGGGGATTTATSTVAESKAQVWSSVPTGSSISLNVDKAGIAITSVAVNDVKSELKNVDLEVASLTANPVSADAAAKVYQYLRITKKNIADTDAGSFKIGFRVTKAWLTENGLASGDVSLYRYKSGWNELTTRVAGTDSTYVNYEADTPGFSSFAVGVKSGAEVVDDVSDEVTDDVPGEVAAPDEVEAPKAIEGPGKAPVAWIIAAVVIILGIILLVAFQKKKQ